MDRGQLKEHMEIVGADGAHVGTLDKVEGDRIKLAKHDTDHADHAQHAFLPIGLIAEVEGDKVRLSATAANAIDMFETVGDDEDSETQH